MSDNNPLRVLFWQLNGMVDVIHCTVTAKKYLLLSTRVSTHLDFPVSEHWEAILVVFKPIGLLLNF